ncbi:MAG TPA: toll/interleukin-1 receptor domain-containing protein [Pyrinomonadaceae bacterium]|nr:toll/interleukin-1 receptor domain-containing protein [Pyrinomonadaceae bacterium]
MNAQLEEPLATASQQDDYKYWAFISYSHQDEAWARWLHKSLETYKVPRKLVGRPLEIGTETGTVPRRIFPIFRDREELPGAADLGGKLKNALRQSRYLIVICSPKSAVSQWVNEEIKTYKALGREDRVLCLIVDGEPYASEKPESGLLECFPSAVRYRVDEAGELTTEKTEPIAADARKGKDGRVNAKFKLLAGILGVGYDELKQREKRRRALQQLRLASGIGALILLAVLTYLAVADKGLNVPGGESIRTMLDRHNASLLRPVKSEAEIRTHAVTLRKSLLEALLRGQTPEGWIASSLRPKVKKEFELWSHSQALSAAFGTPDRALEDQIRKFVVGLEAPFAPGLAIEKDGIKYGWISHPNETHTQAEPALWTAIALSKALGRPGLLTAEQRERAERQMAYTQEVLKLYHPLETAAPDGWNMFPRQKDLSLHNTYTTALALLALLEMRAAGVGWEGSAERRDALLNETAEWLINDYIDDSDPPGWKASGETTNEPIDGLTLQIYSELLRAEVEAGINLSATDKGKKIIEQMPRYLASTAARPLTFPVASGEFAAPIIDRDGKDSMDREAVGFLWYPWAINACVRWLDRAERQGAPMEERVRVRRALGHLVVGLGDEAVKKASEEWTFQDAETLYGMAAIPPPG